MTIKLLEPQSRRWTRTEYYRLAEQGWFQGQRVQLIGREIIQRPVQGHAHYVTLDRIGKLLASRLGAGWWVRAQAPLDVSADSDPEPDIAVVKGSPEDYTDHPTSAALVIEVSDTTLQLDRRKAGIYAAGGVAEYWIVDLNGKKLEVHRNPIPNGDQEFGYAYDDWKILDTSGVIAPLAWPNIEFFAAELLG